MALVSDPVPGIDLTPYGCGCCECNCITCVGEHCPDRLCAIFEGDGYDSSPANKVVFRVRLTWDLVSAGFYPPASGSGGPGYITVECLVGYFRVTVSYGFVQPGIPSQGWGAVYTTDVPMDDCEEASFPLDLTIDLSSIIYDTHPSSSPPATVRVIISDPNALGHPGEEDARNACCHFSDGGDYLCDRPVSGLPATVTVSIDVVPGIGPAAFPSTISGTIPLLNVVYSSGYCWEARYEGDWVVADSVTFYDSPDGITYTPFATADIAYRVFAQLKSNGYLHRYSPFGAPYGVPDAGSPVAGTMAGSVGAEVAFRNVVGTLPAGEGAPGLLNNSGFRADYRSGCELFDASLYYVPPPPFSPAPLGGYSWMHYSSSYTPPPYQAYLTASGGGTPALGGAGVQNGYIAAVTITE